MLRFQSFIDNQMKQASASEVRINIEEPSSPSKTETPSINIRPLKSRNRATGLLILLIMFGAFWVYGWGGEIRRVQSNTQPSNLTSQVIYSKLIILSALFTVIGFGLLLAYYKHMGMVALFLSSFVVSMTVICSPFVSKFWFNVFISDFRGATFKSTDPIRFLLQSFGDLSVLLDFYNLKVAFANCISQLVMFLGVFGRLNIPQVVLNTILYNVAWNLCHFLCAKLVTVGPDTRIFDDYQISNVYLFASCYALTLSLLLPKGEKRQLSQSKPSAILALLGTFFVFLSFCATSTMFPLKFTPGQAEYARSYIWQEAFLSVFFALSGSVIFACAGSVLFGTKKDELRGVHFERLGIRQCVFGTISGGISYGAVAGTSVNVGAAIASGLFSGLLSSILYRFVHKKVNHNGLLDSYGVISTLLGSFFGTFLIAPCILIAYYNRDWILTTLSVSNLDTVGLPLVNSSIVGWILSYVGISMGIGLVSGLLAALLLRLFNSEVSLHNQEYFSLHYGLSPNNPEIFQQDLPISTKFESAVAVLKSRRIEKKAILSVIESYAANREEGKLYHTKEDFVDVRLHGDFGQADIHGITQQLKNFKITPTVSREEGPIQPFDGGVAEGSREFKTIYYLLKSREVQNHLNGSSLSSFKAETIQRSVGGVIERRATINATFDKRDEGADYLDFLKKNYDGLSLQTNIKS